MRNLIFSTHAQGVFASMGTDYESMNNLMKDLAAGKEIFDAESGRVISKAEANAKVLEFSRQIIGFKEGCNKKELRRAFRDNGREWLDIIEDTVDEAIATGFRESEWFNDLVETKNIAMGDRQDFYVENDAVLSVAKVGVSHHDHILQRLGGGRTFTIPTDRYTVKIGADINKYLLGQVDWSGLIVAIARAYMLKIQADIYTQVTSAASALPVQTGFVDTGSLGAATKDRFDTIITNVSAANDGVPVVIMGTQTALKKISALPNANYIAKVQKDNVAQTGTIGVYEGTILVEVPQRFTDKTLTTKLFDDDKLLVMPVIDNKMIKFIDEGDTEITEVTEKGEAGGRWDDLMSYEVQRTFGVGTVIGKYFGQWTIQ